MSDPVQPAAAPVVAAAPAVETPAVAAAPVAEAPPKRTFKNPYAKPAAAPVAAVAASPEAPAAKPAGAPKSRALALAQSKLATVTTELAPLRERAARYETLLAPIVERELATIPESARAVIVKKHGKDAAATLDEINYLRSLGAFAAPPAPTTTTTTAANPTAPPAPDASDPDVTAYRRHESLSKQSPTAAQMFRSSNAAAIARGAAKSASRN